MGLPLAREVESLEVGGVFVCSCLEKSREQRMDVDGMLICSY